MMNNKILNRKPIWDKPFQLRSMTWNLQTMCFALMLLFSTQAIAATSSKSFIDQLIHDFNEYFNRPFSIALIAAQPYGKETEDDAQAMLDSLQKNRKLEWIMHLGDIKSGTELCTDALLKSRIGNLNDSRKPLVYVPGDNEWTDCHREDNGSFKSQERLAFIRKQAFEKPNTLGKSTFRVKQQNDKGFPEHLMWQKQHVLFMTLNVPGSNNDLLNPPSRGVRDDEVQRLFEARHAAISAWFDEAEKTFKSKTPPKAIVIAIQGNPIDGSGRTFKAASGWSVFDGYDMLMKRMVQFIETTKQPVLLIHGDTNRFRMDRPSLSKFGGTKEVEALFYRLETWGYPDTKNWVQLTIAPGKKPTFSAQSMRIGQR